MTLAVIVVMAGCGGNDDEEPAAPERIDRADLEDCGKLPVPNGFRCGEIEVPFERTDASYGTTTIGFAVRPRDDGSSPSQGAIFAVEGGPGYSSTGTANAYQKLFGDLLEHRELVLVDQRGQGRSELFDCPDLQHGNGPDFIVLPLCAERLGKRFISYRTAAAADDIDDVRAALGYDTIALYGDSYGTFLGQSYAFRHGDRLDALVLDSAYPAYGEDPWYPSIVNTGIEAMGKACDRSPKCSGDAIARLEELLEYLRDSKRGAGYLLDELFDAGYSPPDSYLRIDRVGQKLIAGDRGPWRRLIRAEKMGSGRQRVYSRAGEMVTSCNDYPMIWNKESSEAERRRELQEAIHDYDPDAFPPFTPKEVAISSNIGYLYCMTFPKPTDVYEPPVDPETDQPTEAPVLVVSGELDDVTTPDEGEVVAGFFPDSEQYIARNAGHVDALYYKNGEAATKIRDFLHQALGD